MASALVATPSSLTSDVSNRSTRHTVIQKRKYDPNDAPVIEYISDPTKTALYLTAQFDPDVHLTFNSQAHTRKIYTDDLGLSADEVISPVGAVYPFELFSQEAVDIMKWEVTRPEILSRYLTASTNAKCQLRGYARDSCPFTYAAWTHPRTVEIVSQLAGIPLEVIYDYEVAHTNFAFENKNSEEKDTSSPVVNWHFDSYPFVCVLMLSETSDMNGGETCLRNELGDAFKVEDPRRGHATVLQGRYIEHLASKPQSGKERITMVTSYRPRSAFVKDDSVLNNVLPSSDLDELFTDWTEYRMARLEEQLEKVKNEVRASRREGEAFDLAKVTATLVESEKYLSHTHQMMHGKNK